MITGASFVKKYLTVIGLLICLVVLSVFWGFYYRSTELIQSQLLYQGQSFFQEIVITRQWLAQHNGVYVKMEPGVTVNPYLLQVSNLKVVIKDEDGQLYTLKNPALATREISEMAQEKGLLQFHITSLNPLNPANSPDPFERQALQSFASGVKEVGTFETRGDEVYFRYMAPLATEKSCLNCHQGQGYQEGDIRGGISVTCSATETTRKIHDSQVFLVLSAILIILLSLGIIYLVARSFIKDLHAAEDKLVEMATYDFLTKLLNRRETYHRLGEELQRARRLNESFSVLLIDLDHFKQVNDVYGHSAGDIVLQSVAETMRQEVRPYDLCCRYGGEEFLVILPSSNLEIATTIAERIRCSIEKLEIGVAPATHIHVTASIGVATLIPGENVDQLIARADEAMYVGKQQGRNCVNVAPAVSSKE